MITHRQINKATMAVLLLLFVLRTSMAGPVYHEVRGTVPEGNWTSSLQLVQNASISSGSQTQTTSPPKKQGIHAWTSFIYGLVVVFVIAAGCGLDRLVRKRRASRNKPETAQEVEANTGEGAGTDGSNTAKQNNASAGSKAAPETKRVRKSKPAKKSTPLAAIRENSDPDAILPVVD
jgi:cytoskeletal protein RodZ